MKYSILIVFLFMLSWQVSAQSERKVVMQLTSADTLVHLSLYKLLHHLREADPEIEIEVVCHGPGLSLLKKPNQAKLDKALAQANGKLHFVACENTMLEKKITKEQLAGNIEFVRAGIIEIIDKQQADWSYIKVGF
jgi:intracellular sulfur oxidation DsrE/DsrF family protein